MLYSYDSMKKNFIDLSKEGNLEKLKEIYAESPEIYSYIRNHDNFDSPFLYACKNGKINVAKWFFKIMPNINVSAIDDWAFRESCKNGHKHVCEWLLEINPDINISKNNDIIFRETCEAGQTEMAKWLFKIKPNIDISTWNEYAFLAACSNGHLETIKWLLEIKPDINISASDNYGNNAAFRVACKYDYIKIAKWLLEVKPGLDVSVRDFDDGFDENDENDDDEYGIESPFRLACYYGNINIVKWLLKIKPDINITAVNNFAFIKSCENNEIEVAQFLQSLKPEKYYLETSDNKIINYFVNKIVIKNTYPFGERYDIEICPICYQNQSDIITNCKHQYCNKCIQKLSSRFEEINEIKCPLCRKTNLDFYKLK